MRGGHGGTWGDTGICGGTRRHTGRKGTRGHGTKRHGTKASSRRDTGTRPPWEGDMGGPFALMWGHRVPPCVTTRHRASRWWWTSGWRATSGTGSRPSWSSSTSSSAPAAAEVRPPRTPSPCHHPGGCPCHPARPLPAGTVTLAMLRELQNTEIIRRLTESFDEVTGDVVVVRGRRHFVTSVRRPSCHLCEATILSPRVPAILFLCVPATLSPV